MITPPKFRHNLGLNGICHMSGNFHEGRSAKFWYVNRYYIFIHRLCSWALLKIHSNSYMFVVWYHLLVSSRILEKGSSHGFQPNQDWKFFEWQFSNHKYLNIEPTQSSKSNPKKRFNPALVESECRPWYIKNTVGITVAIWRNKSSLTTNRVISHF